MTEMLGKKIRNQTNLHDTEQLFSFYFNFFVMCVGAEMPVCCKDPNASHLRSSSMEVGRSRYERHKLEKRDMVAPSMTLWSADQLTLITRALTSSPAASNLGRICVWKNESMNEGEGKKEKYAFLNTQTVPPPPLYIYLYKFFKCSITAGSFCFIFKY